MNKNSGSIDSHRTSTEPHEASKVVLFTYHYWQIPESDNKTKLSFVTQQLGKATQVLFQWLNHPIPPLKSPPENDDAKKFQSWEWLTTKSPSFPNGLIAATNRDEVFGYAHAAEFGDTLFLLVASIANNANTPPSVFNTLKEAHWVSDEESDCSLGSLQVMGVSVNNFSTNWIDTDSKITHRFFDGKQSNEWCYWRDKYTGGQVAISSELEPLRENNRLYVIADERLIGERIAARLVNVILPALGRYKLRIESQFTRNYLYILKPHLRAVEHRLSEFQGPKKTIDELDAQISQISDEIHQFAGIYADVQCLKQGIDTDISNMMSLFQCHNLPEESVFWEITESLRLMARQLDTDLGYSSIQLESSKLALQALNIQAGIIRVRESEHENRLSKKRNIILTLIGLILGLSAIIDRELGQSVLQHIHNHYGQLFGYESVDIALVRILLLTFFGGIFLSTGALILSITRLIRGILPHKHSSLRK